VREHDGFRIPYETVEAITLIALVRLNLVQGTKDLLYDQLLKMGIYEDMAPWNIAFKGGKLVYIDYDTRDIDLTKFVPMAYQVRKGLEEKEGKSAAVESLFFFVCVDELSTPYSVHIALFLYCVTI
jgi:hypothetical protein